MRRALGTFVVFLLATLAASEAHATLSRAMDLAELVRESEIVALVQVRGQSARRDARQRIVTDVEMDLLEPVKGSPGARFTLIQLGGELGEVGMAIAGETSFDVSKIDVEKIVMSQGVMLVDDDPQGNPQAHPGGGGLSLVDPRTGAHQPPALLGPTRLDVLLDEIRRLAEL